MPAFVADMIYQHSIPPPSPPYNGLLLYILLHDCSVLLRNSGKDSATWFPFKNFNLQMPASQKLKKPKGKWNPCFLGCLKMGIRGNPWESVLILCHNYENPYSYCATTMGIRVHIVPQVWESVLIVCHKYGSPCSYSATNMGIRAHMVSQLWESVLILCHKYGNPCLYTGEERLAEVRNGLF